MNYEILFIPPFARQLKRLSKRYVSLAEDYSTLLESLENNPLLGEPVGRNCYKVRLAITSKNKGKSSGARVITNVLVENKKVYLLSIYDKFEQENIADKEIERLLAFIDET